MPGARAGAGAAAAAALRLRKKKDDAPIQKAQQTGPSRQGLKSQSVSDAFQRAESGESPTSGRVALDKRAREEEEKREKSFFSSFFPKKEERGMFNRTYDKGRFADRDLNADGLMTFEELRVFMQNQDPEVSEAQVREKFAAMDTNKDGKVNHKESVTTIRINLKRTLAGLERWNGSLETGDAGTLKGYYSLATYALFFAIFTYVVVAQLQVCTVY